MEKLYIWDKIIPGNCKKNKLDDMEIKGNPNKLVLMLRFLNTIKSRIFLDKKYILDTFTYNTCIKDGEDKENYEDEPYLIPYLVPDSDCAVIVIPGGAYCYKQMDSEGEMVAEQLNRAGISAFVLWYRSNPYRMPIPLLDVQRAVRFLRFHAKDYGLSEKKIGLVGFSAGGYQVAGFINLLRGKNQFPQNYIMDEIDAVDDHVNQAALVYPCLEFNECPTLLFAVCPPEQVRDKVKRQQLLAEFDCITNMDSADIPQFLSFGTKENLINADQFMKYGNKLLESGGSCCIVPVEGVGHGYGAKPETLEKYGYWMTSYLRWSKAQFMGADSGNVKQLSPMEEVSTFHAKLHKIYENTYEIFEESEIPGCGSVKSFLLVGKEKALLIDCGSGIIKLERLIRKVTDKPVILACTHGHFDHAFGGKSFGRRYMHSQDIPLYESYTKKDKIIETYTKVKSNIPKETLMQKAELVYQKNRNVCFGPLEDIEKFDLGDRIVSWIHTPGHTAGSVCYYDESANVLFSGDTLSTMVWVAVMDASTVTDYLSSLDKIIDFSREKKIEKTYIAHTKTGNVHDPIEMAQSLKKGTEAILKGKKGISMKMGLVQGQVIFKNGKVILWDKEHIK